MIKFTLLSVATVMSTALVVPALAQGVIQARWLIRYLPSEWRFKTRAYAASTTRRSCRQSWECQCDGISAVFPSIDART